LRETLRMCVPITSDTSTLANWHERCGIVTLKLICRRLSSVRSRTIDVVCEVARYCAMLEMKRYAMMNAEISESPPPASVASVRSRGTFLRGVGGAWQARTGGQARTASKQRTAAERCAEQDSL
jgi:hypothetical protein